MEVSLNKPWGSLFRGSDCFIKFPLNFPAEERGHIVGLDSHSDPPATNLHLTATPYSTDLDQLLGNPVHIVTNLGNLVHIVTKLCNLVHIVHELSTSVSSGLSCLTSPTRVPAVLK